MVHTWREDGGVPSLLELMLKDGQTPGPSKCASLYGAQHIFSPAKLFQKVCIIFAQQKG